VCLSFKLQRGVLHCPSFHCVCCCWNRQSPRHAPGSEFRNTTEKAWLMNI